MSQAPSGRDSTPAAVRAAPSRSFGLGGYRKPSPPKKDSIALLRRKAPPAAEIEPPSVWRWKRVEEGVMPAWHLSKPS